MTSASYQILEFLKSHTEVVEFTSDDLAEAVGVTQGASSGFLNRLIKLGVAERVGRKGHQYVYRVEPQFYSEVTVHRSAGPGSSKGRSVSRGPHTPVPVLKDLPTLLREAADIAEQTPLSGFTNEQLLAELARRLA